jgi:hypothetical protein
MTLADPVTALLDALKVNVLLVPLADCGLNTAVTPPGRPLALSATLLLKPAMRVNVIVLVAIAP